MAGDSAMLKKEDSNTSIKKNRKDLFDRILSIFIFLPVIMLIHFDFMFALFCFGACIVMASEIFSTKIRGHFLIRFSTLAICVLGIGSFIYCRKIFEVSGCVFLICIASFTDIGAYCFGKAFGGSKLCPKISPNKTWAGFWGGIFLSNVAFYCLNNLFLLTYFNWEFLPGGINGFVIVQCIILASVAGDLLESLFKRRMGVKDMGNLFPGHGGMLDRLDSLVLASITLAVISIFL